MSKNKNKLQEIIKKSTLDENYNNGVIVDPIEEVILSPEESVQLKNLLKNNCINLQHIFENIQS